MIFRKGLCPEKGVIPGRKYTIVCARNIYYVKPVPSILTSVRAFVMCLQSVECSLYPTLSQHGLSCAVIRRTLSFGLSVG